MAITIKNAYADQPAAAATTLYTCPAGTVSRVLKCTTTNDTTSVITFKAYKVPSGQAAGDAYLILNDKALGSKETYECPEVVGQILDASDFIVFHPSAATQLSVLLDVVEIV